MSFILDALKKAESERNRGNGPVLMDVRIAAPRRRLPAWAWVFGAILAANLALLAWLMLRQPAPAPAADAATQTAAATPATAALPAATTPAAAPVQLLPPVAIPPAAAPSPPVAPAPAADAASQTTTADDIDRLPSAQELQAAGVPLPTLQLNLLAYNPDPAHRYVLLNSTRLREGEFTPDGVKVERITASGVVLEASGRRFLLRAGY